MKILIYSDVHFCQDSSIVRTVGEKYSTRLEYLIKSLNWAENLALQKGCNAIFNLGDTFDKPTLNAMEITALKDVRWADIVHYVIVGNHDSNVNSLEYSSSEVFNTLPNFKIISSPYQLDIDADRTSFLFLPYIIDDDRKPIASYIKNPLQKKIILSHNDLKGIQLGKYISQSGFDIKDIESNCDLFLNGHIHNQAWISSRILDVGNLCGKNFGEDSFKYSHGVWILNTDDLNLEFIENPFSLNFYKLDIDKQHPSLNSYELKNNAVLMIKCEKSLLDNLNAEIKLKKEAIVCSKIIVHDDTLSNSVKEINIEKLDYLKTFNEFITEKLGESNIINYELNEICK